MAEVERKVKNMRIFKSTHPPTNRQAWGMALDNAGNTLDARALSADQVKLYFRVMIQTMAHRAVLRGTGFYEVLSQDRTGLSIGSLPSMCYRLYDDRYLMQCITEEAGYHDLQRFREYLLGRELNIGLIIGPSGSGTTTLGAAAALAMQVQLGQILCSGPSHEAIDIFADRLDRRARAVAARYNTVMPAGDSKRCHHRMVVRMYKLGDELIAVTKLVRNSEDLDWTARRDEFADKSHWKLHLSLTYWFLVVMRSGAVPPLDEDSKPGLVKLQAEIDTRPDMLHLRQWVTGQMDSATYATPIITIKDVLFQVMRQADFLCVHPADTEISPIPQWKITIARGLVIGEAGSMSRADFYGLWGNSLLPCFLFGDPDEKPVVLTTDEADGDGNLYNRFAADGAVSPLKYLMATGIPAFRLELPARP
ncbi:DNA helicase [Fusarium napiforme]|uniref:DNA helicase n=1 Tax=Fusarium napiforme TaxID=42672 RepID=A0A8H5I5B4_9HYPO|nr:DNA helicase [Fusarium napiforme]